jgi:hypothetical protein
MGGNLRRMFPTSWFPRSQTGDGYQYDLDGALRYNRLKTGIDKFPYVGGDGTIPFIGAINGLLPQNDIFVWAQAVGKRASGPGSTTQPINLQYQITVPGLYKL